MQTSNYEWRKTCKSRGQKGLYSFEMFPWLGQFFLSAAQRKLMWGSSFFSWTSRKSNKLIFTITDLILSYFQGIKVDSILRLYWWFAQIFNSAPLSEYPILFRFVKKRSGLWNDNKLIENAKIYIEKNLIDGIHSIPPRIIPEMSINWAFLICSPTVRCSILSTQINLIGIFYFVMNWNRFDLS